MNEMSAGLTVGELMTPEPIVIREDEPLARAAMLLDEHRITGLPVVDAAGILVGVVTQSDLLRARATEHLWKSWPGLSVRHLMSRPVLTVRRSSSVEEAVRLMEQQRVHRLVVVDDAGLVPVGIFSTTDVIHQIAGASERE